MIDIDRARAETPGCRHVIHLNNAGAALQPTPVLDAVRDHLELEARIGGYEAAARNEALWQGTYDSLARLINCDRDELAVVENATRAWDMAFYGLELGPGDRILTSVAEYGSNYLAYLQAQRRTGVAVEVIPNNEHGELSVDALADALDERVKLVSVTHVPTNGGLVNPAEEIGRLTRDAGVLFLLDACQSVGQLQVDVDAIGCDLMAVTGRKFLRAPRGTGFLYCRRETTEGIEPPFIDVLAAHWDSPTSYTLRADARRFENWETNYTTKIALGVAAEYAMSWGIDQISERVRLLAAQMRDRLSPIPGVTVMDLGRERCGIVTFTVAGRDPTDISSRLGNGDINTSVSSIEDTLLDMAARDHEEWVRASVHYYNTEDEINALIDHVGDLAKSG